MKELIRTPNIVVISALQATLRAEGIEAFEFDGPIADTLAGFSDFPRRLFVHDDDYDAARGIMMELCPEEVEAI
jgi:Putative prokaryotic signal transducing protein